MFCKTFEWKTGGTSILNVTRPKVCMILTADNAYEEKAWAGYIVYHFKSVSTSTAFIAWTIGLISCPWNTLSVCTSHQRWCGTEKKTKKKEKKNSIVCRCSYTVSVRISISHTIIMAQSGVSKRIKDGLQILKDWFFLGLDFELRRSSRVCPPSRPVFLPSGLLKDKMAAHCGAVWVCVRWFVWGSDGRWLPAIVSILFAALVFWQGKPVAESGIMAF